ncbi:MAG: exodeoxyribonuclease III [Gammaproteobacteria bacterium]|nr:exodeoxyribonuclease III [Gammaproteobacteria bacterium]
MTDNILKIATWNVNSLNVRLPHVLQWLESEQPDILVLQETKTVDEKFPAQAIDEAGYHVIYAGQKTYNGVAILSRQPAAEIVTDFPGFDDPQRRVLAATIGNIRILNVYIPNGSSVGAEKYQYKLQWLTAMQAYIEQQLTEYDQFVILGDFNIAPDDRDVHDPSAWQGQILVSEAERQAFQAMLTAGLSDTFRLFEQEEKHFSWWDYRAGAFHRNHGMRIDHILTSKILAESCQAVTIDRQPRKWQRPSDHAPVMASFRL